MRLKTLNDNPITKLPGSTPTKKNFNSLLATGFLKNIDTSEGFFGG